MVISSWAEFLDKSEGVKVITKPFIEAVIQATHKMDMKYCIENIGQYSWARIYNDNLFAVIIDGHNLTFFLFQSGELVLFWKGSSRDENKDIFTSLTIDVSTNIEYVVTASMAQAVKYSFFMKFAEVQVKVLGPSKREKLFNCKYKNETDMPIQILDSTWFTNLVKSEGFKVRGHFRLQPYGEGMSKKKLIYIQDFEKQGYSRTAKKLNRYA